MQGKTLESSSAGVWSDQTINLDDESDFLFSFYCDLSWCLNRGGKLIIYREDNGGVCTDHIEDGTLESKSKSLYVSEYINKIEKNKKGKFDEILKKEIANKIIFDMRKKSNIYIEEWPLPSEYKNGYKWENLFVIFVLMVLLLFCLYFSKFMLKEMVLWILS